MSGTLLWSGLGLPHHAAPLECTWPSTEPPGSATKSARSRCIRCPRLARVECGTSQAGFLIITVRIYLACDAICAVEAVCRRYRVVDLSPSTTTQCLSICSCQNLVRAQMRGFRGPEHSRTIRFREIALMPAASISTAPDMMRRWLIEL